MRPLIKVTLSAYFTAKNGETAMITGDHGAIEAIEKIFEAAGVKFNDEVETWDEGYYE
jgi:hypothetical protein